MIDFYDACRQHRQELKKFLHLPFAETIDRWVRVRRIGHYYKREALRYFRLNKIDVKLEDEKDLQSK